MKQYTFRNAAATWWAEYWTDGMATTDNQKILSIRSMSVGGVINHTDLDDTMIALGLPNKVGAPTTEVELKTLALALNLKLEMQVDESAVVTKNATLDVQATPTFTAPAGAVVLGDVIVIASATADKIYYTLDGSIPTDASIDQSLTPATITALPCYLKAVAYKAGKYHSIVGEAYYTQAVSDNLSNLVMSGSPTGFIFAAGTYAYTGAVVLAAVATVTITPTGAGVIQVNGVTVTSGQASDPIALTGGVGQVITVTVTETGHATKTYTIGVTRNLAAAATPTFSPVAGAVAYGTLLTITSAGANAIYYTVDGSTPSAAKTLYEGPFAIATAETVKAIGITAGHDDSAVGSAAYTQAAASVPTEITLAVGSATPVGGVTNVVIPAAGATDNTGKITGWVETLNSKIKFTVVDDTGVSTITIGGAPYVSGADYLVTSLATQTIVVTTTEAGKVTGVRTFTIDVAAA
jgi:hypothetical protein